MTYFEAVNAKQFNSVIRNAAGRTGVIAALRNADTAIVAWADGERSLAPISDLQTVNQKPGPTT
jgi:2-C-methyl-D-erythritol 4-phosphate cytidylyltransferase